MDVMDVVVAQAVGMRAVAHHDLPLAVFVAPGVA